MNAFILIIGACIFFYLLHAIQLEKRKMKNKKEYIQWGLSVDCCVFYSRPFTVSKQSIILNGFQEVMDKKSPICYSLVKVNWWGKREIYAQAFILGNYKDTTGFQIVMENIPSGDHYQIEVSNGFKMSRGQFRVM